MKQLITLSVLLLMTANLSAQTNVTNDSVQLKKLYTEALTKGKSYLWLQQLTKKVGHRLTGSEGDKKAVAWAKAELDKLGLTKVWLQPVTVPHWVRGEKEEGHVATEFGNFNVNIRALGGSIATPEEGLLAEVIEVKSLKEVEELGDKVKGKIVFYNGAMPADKIETFKAYGAAVGQRVNGAAVAGKYGAIGAIVRSMTTKIDNVPHTGTMRYGDIDESQKIPTAAISTNSAEMLSSLLKQNDKMKLKFYFKQNCKNLPDTQSFNVIGEIEGLNYPDEIMVVGGHLDSWDLGEGAHDDGAGVVQSMEVLRLFKTLRIKNKRTLRVVLFANEEFGLSGGKAYAAEVVKKKENHIVALESDSGGFSPRGFGFTCNDKNYDQVLQWKSLFEPYNIHIFARGGGGADIGPLKKDDNVLLGLKPDSQRYFDYHHTEADVFEAVNQRELELGAASMASMLYLFDQYGVVK
ncbi:M20/M25/M40 family metallo-hydrolase [Aureibaculum sp. A20]|uniref:Carboxypeptidase Q n=1 Tax=Aureibaculum flavum TaxID=2795986 RepID=A0ABS0WWD2_9FLAO|nr:M20/M25/M40 family metallo-hydrolase [Aureibaculum flavum]MBJ2176294.1 M20/M25/M40 family metallo-hydrolase [Aureibaculum flavum]